MAVDLKDPFLQKAVLAGLGLAGVLYLFFGTSVLSLCYRPQAARAGEIREEVARLEADLNRAKQTAQGLKSLETQYAELQKDWGLAQSLLPEKDEIPEFLTGVTRSGLDCGLQVLMFEPKSTIRHDFYTESPVAMKVSGQYHQAGEFLARVSNLPRLINVQKLQIRERTGAENKGETVEMEMVLSAYYLESGSAPGATSPQKAANSPQKAGESEPTVSSGKGH